jgi:hypothetical protein
MFEILAEAQSQAVNWLLESAKLILPAFIVGVIVWHHQKRYQAVYESKSYLNQKRLDALMKAWSLLAYITEKDNPKAVLQADTNSAGTREIYIRREQAREYMIGLSEMFYESGYGLFLESNIKKLFYEYRGLLYGVLLKEKGKHAADEPIKIEQEQMVVRIKEIYDELNAELRKKREKMENRCDF